MSLLQQAGKDILNEIFDLLDDTNLMNLSQTCKYFHILLCSKLIKNSISKKRIYMISKSNESFITRTMILFGKDEEVGNYLKKNMDNEEIIDVFDLLLEYDNLESSQLLKEFQKNFRGNFFACRFKEDMTLDLDNFNRLMEMKREKLKETMKETLTNVEGKEILYMFNGRQHRDKLGGLSTHFYYLSDLHNFNYTIIEEFVSLK